MIKKKNAILTFIFSLVPGAGEMFMGFMKQGVSLMSMFLPALQLVLGYERMHWRLSGLLYGAIVFFMCTICVACPRKNFRR